MIKSQNNFLGNYYPFFLNNYNLTEQHYLYQLYSPGVNEELNPYLSMIKVSEKTYYGNIGKETDILKLCANKIIDSEKNAVRQTPIEYLNEIFKGLNLEIKYGAAKKFPYIEIKEADDNKSLEIPQTLITTLRDALRWKYYRFHSGRFVDILWTPSEFALYKIIIDSENISLEPQGIYENRDVMMQNPLEINYKLQTYKWPKDTFKATDLNRFIKKLELSAFERHSFLD